MNNRDEFEDIDAATGGSMQPSATPIQTTFTAIPETHLQAQVHPARPPESNNLGLIRGDAVIPSHGWRNTLYRLTGGRLNTGESLADAAERALLARVNQPVHGSYSIAVLSLKGGAGKTTTVVSLGTMFASLRGDRVIAVDANPAFGTLAQRGPKQTRSTVRDLLSDTHLLRYSDVRRHTSQSPSRLEFLASDRDPAVSELFSGDDYRAVHRILDRFYNIILTDCGTGLTHSAMWGVLETANALVVVTAPAVDSVRSALGTLDWLEHQGYSHLVSESTVVLGATRPGGLSIDLAVLSAHFSSRVRSLFTISYDQHLAEGAEVFLDLMNRKTRREYLILAAAMADAFR